jgi:hypothetical protein
VPTGNPPAGNAPTGRDPNQIIAQLREIVQQMAALLQ